MNFLEAIAELQKLREQKPVAWMVEHDGAQQIDLTLLKTEAEAIAHEMQEEHFNHGEDGIRIPARITPLYAAPIPAPTPAVPVSDGWFYPDGEEAIRASYPAVLTH